MVLNSDSVTLEDSGDDEDLLVVSMEDNNHLG